MPFLALAWGVSAAAHALPPGDIQLEFVGRYESGMFNQSAAEIVRYLPAQRRLLVVNAAAGRIDQIDLSDPTNPQPRSPLALPPLARRLHGGDATSVDVHGELIAVAIKARVPTDRGSVALFDAAGSLKGIVRVGHGPDMVQFTPDGSRLLVANEGEPNDSYSVDPEGSIGVIDLRRGSGSIKQADYREASFRAFNHAPLDDSVRIDGPGASAAQDLEPEYIAVSPDGRRAYVTLQENNAIAVVDVERAEVVRIFGLGFKDHMQPGNGLDASDLDGGPSIRAWPVFGMYQPDSLAVVSQGGAEYLLTANEGDARTLDGYNEERRVNQLPLDRAAFPNFKTLRKSDMLGRLTVTRALGDADDDGDYDRLYVPGTRSFAVWDAVTGRLVYDSGDALEQLLLKNAPDLFNIDSLAEASADSRSDNRGPEPEGLAVGTVDGTPYAFLGLERPGGIVTIDLASISTPRIVAYTNPRASHSSLGESAVVDLAPEGVLFVSGNQSPTHEPLVIVAHEVSGTVVIYRFIPGQ